MQHSPAVDANGTTEAGAGAGGLPNQALEMRLLELYQSLTTMQTVAGDVQPGQESLVSDAVSQTIQSIGQIAALKPHITGRVPLPVIEAIDANKNPHQFTRNKIEEAVGSNQLTHGKIDAVQDYAKQLETSLFESFPELKAHAAEASSDVAPPPPSPAMANSYSASTADGSRPVS